MAEIVYAERALADLERAFEFLTETDSAAAATVVDIIQDAIGILERHPLIGRSTEHDLRALIISRGRTGYIALYDYIEPLDTIPILALRHQREAGCSDSVEET